MCSLLKNGRNVSQFVRGCAVDGEAIDMYTDHKFLPRKFRIAKLRQFCSHYTSITYFFAFPRCARCTGICPRKSASRSCSNSAQGRRASAAAHSIWRRLVSSGDASANVQRVFSLNKISWCDVLQVTSKFGGSVIRFFNKMACNSFFKYGSNNRCLDLRYSKIAWAL